MFLFSRSWLTLTLTLAPTQTLTLAVALTLIPTLIPTLTLTLTLTLFPIGFGASSVLSCASYPGAKTKTDTKERQDNATQDQEQY